MGVRWYVVCLMAITVHEGAHAMAAKWGGDPTAFRAGQVTLSPLPHMQREPFGTILVPLLSFYLQGWMIGWASAPYDPLWQQRHPRRAAWMALAGPAANAGLMILAGILIRLGLWMGFFEFPGYATFTRVVASSDPGVGSALATFLSILFMLNLLLFTFNLLPVPPLDTPHVVPHVDNEPLAVRIGLPAQEEVGLVHPERTRRACSSIPNGEISTTTVAAFPINVGGQGTTGNTPPVPLWHDIDAARDRSATI